MRAYLLYAMAAVAVAGCNSARLDISASPNAPPRAGRGGLASYIGDRDRDAARQLMDRACAPEAVMVVAKGRLAAHRILLPGPVMAASGSSSRVYEQFECTPTPAGK